MPYPNEHAFRVKSPSAFEKGSFRRKALPGVEGVDIISGKLKGETNMTAQAYRFKKTKWTYSEAQAWLKRHKIKPMLSEKATANSAPLEDEPKILADDEPAFDEQRAELTANMSSLVKDGVFEGEDVYITPAVMIVEGVTNGVLYLEEELKKFPQAWNGRPVPVYHPRGPDGNFVSANTPETLEKRSVGQVFNAHYIDKKLKADIYLLKSKLAKVDPSVGLALNANKMLEVSTCHFFELEPVQGVWNGKKYRGIARAIRPDHFAILPNETGACSIADGAGLPRANQLESEEEEMPDCIHKALDGLKAAAGDLLVGAWNALSARDTEKMLRDKLRAQHAKTERVYVLDLYPNEVVYEVSADEKPSRLYKQTYKKGKKGVPELTGMATEVMLQKSYVPAANSDSDNRQSNEENDEMKREERIAALVKDGKVKEEDTEHLMALNDATFDSAFPTEPKKDEDPKANAQEPEKKAEPVKKQEEDPTPAANAQEPKEKKDEPKKAENVDDFVANAPAEVRETLERAIAADKARKAELVAALVANKRNAFSEEELNAKSIDELEKLEKSIAPEANFAGRPNGQPTKAVNVQSVEPMAMPGYQAPEADSK